MQTQDVGGGLTRLSYRIQMGSVRESTVVLTEAKNVWWGVPPVRAGPLAPLSQLRNLYLPAGRRAGARPTKGPLVGGDFHEG